jgi:menaquinone-dependent protoporphyrinogen oxidase
MSVLVAYASRHGATAGIAERIAARLKSHDLQAEAVAIRDVRHPEAYEAIVIGSAVYMFHWLKDASGFIRRHRTLLESRPVWLFSSGPIGPDVPDKEGHMPREVADSRDLPRLAAEVKARDQRVFFGAFDPAARPIGLVERLTMAMPAARAAFPAGDFRNWPEIDAWADEIAAELRAI